MSLCGVETKMGTDWSPFFLLACRGEFGSAPGCFDHPIRSDAADTNTNALGLAIHNGSHALQIGEPTPLGFIVGMTDIVASPGSLATNLADAGHMRATRTLNFKEKITTKKATYTGPMVQVPGI